MNNTPYYKKIFNDILDNKYPEKRIKCQKLLDKESLTHLDVITINKLIFGDKSSPEDDKFNQQHRFYSESAIIQMLRYQYVNKLSNSQLARHFKLSRNTVARWKKHFTIKIK
ncbi:helix-turn-helix domain-containing protein [Chryseobacterium sp. M5]|uniref:helix-turn-helix domain-containing protein n=1 Tax=Chryseobacterium sp. M5 TaxID=3379128 RepID=UPI0038579AE1